ncbi:MAG: hypothetical protein WCT77_00400 [Bacteroidota bacterium]
MNDREKIEQLKREIAQSESKMANCKHDFATPIYDAETVKEGYGSVQDGAGSDPHWSYAGYRDVQKDRWSRECKICGKKEYTYKQEPVIKNYEPKF